MPGLTLPPEARAQLAAVRDGAVRVAPLMGIPRLLRDLGQDPAAVLAEAGVARDTFDDPERVISFAAGGRLLALCAERTACAHFGVLLGEGTGPGTLGLVGMLAACSPDLGTALRNLVLHLHLHDRGAIPTLSVDNGRALLGYVIYQPGIEGTAQIYDLALVLGNNLMRALYGPAWRPQEVRLAHAKPADLDPYRRAFRAPMRFDADRSGLVFPAAWLTNRPPGADPGLYEALQGRIADLAGPVGRDLRAQVRRVTCNLLLGEGGSREAVAAAMCVHPRTLNRRLRDQGTSFRQVREECLHQLARQFLGDTGLAVADIASILGYADVPAFTRAFRRWTRTTPAAWRAGNRSA